MKLLIIGASGMLGSTLMQYFATQQRYTVVGTMRPTARQAKSRVLGNSPKARIIAWGDDLSFHSVCELLDAEKPDVVINCAGAIKQTDEGLRVTSAIPVNSLLPHWLAAAVEARKTRLIHFSTDCVFTGSEGNYTESDAPDARDIYGLSKYLGEVSSSYALTLRTSIIGHELASSRSLVEWFLSADGVIDGFGGAIYSGLPATEIARVLHLYVIPSPKLSGLLHLASQPITKYELLMLINEVYDLGKDIRYDKSVVIDRSLNSSKFNELVGYTVPAWRCLISEMKEFYLGRN